jgi:hypothetical protein
MDWAEVLSNFLLPAEQGNSAVVSFAIRSTSSGLSLVTVVEGKRAWTTPSPIEALRSEIEAASTWCNVLLDFPGKSAVASQCCAAQLTPDPISDWQLLGTE